VNALDDQPLDARLVLLARAAARLMLFECREFDIKEASEGLVDDMWTFWRACEMADAAYFRAPPTAKKANVANNAPGATVEALAYSCRQGPKALERPENIQRLVRLSVGQLRDIHAQVQQFRQDLEYEGAKAARWSTEQADVLLEKWHLIHG
jgi:hypothetical protein